MALSPSAAPLSPVPPSRWSAFLRFLRSEGAKGYLFIAPWLIGFLAFGLWPLLITIYNSLTNDDLFSTPEWVGLQNYVKLFTADPVFVHITWNMIAYVSASTCVTIGGGLGLALLLNQRFPGNHLFRTIFYVPSLLIGVAVGTMFRQTFAPGTFGLFNQVLALFHLPTVNWIGNYDHPWISIVALILVNCWFTGGAMIIFLAGLKGISPTYYEAARIDGAGPVRIFRSITLPLLSPVVILNTIITLIGHIQVFDTPLIFSATGSSFTANSVLGYKDSVGTFLTYIYQKAFADLEYGYASALAMIVFAITLILALLILWISRRFSYYGDQVN